MKENLPLEHSKLITLLRCLDEKEFKDLGLWLHSPFLNKSKNAIQLYAVFKTKYLKKEKTVKPLDLMRYMEMLPKTAKEKDVSPKHRQYLKKAMHELTVQIQNFLVWKVRQEDDMEAQFHLIDVFRTKRLYKFVEQEINKTQKMHEATTRRDIKYCEDDYRLVEKKFHSSVILKNRATESTPKNVIDSLRISSLSQLLRYYCAAVNTSKIIKTDQNYAFMKVVKQYLESSPDLNNFTIRTYYMLLKLLEDEQAKDYYELKEHLLASSTAFDVYELRQLLSFMSNYCSRMVLSGKTDFVKEKFEIYDIGLNLGVWTADVYFSIHLFVQIFKIALQLDKIDWASHFLTEYRDSLSPDLRNNTLNYCQALAAFKNKDYDLAQQHLIQIDAVEDFAYHLEIEILLVKIYYDSKEVDLVDAIDSKIEAIRKYVSPDNKKIAETTRQEYHNFTNFFKRILSRRKKCLGGNIPSPANIAALQSDLNNLNPLRERSWLEEKITELTIRAYWK